jgi:hypothetical protein
MPLTQDRAGSWGGGSPSSTGPGSIYTRSLVSGPWTTTQRRFVEPGTCFRFRHNGVGHAAHCREPIVARGLFIDGAGKLWRMDACAEHAEELGGAVMRVRQ